MIFLQSENDSSQPHYVRKGLNINGYVRKLQMVLFARFFVVISGYFSVFGKVCLFGHFEAKEHPSMSHHIVTPAMSNEPYF